MTREQEGTSKLKRVKAQLEDKKLRGTASVSLEGFPIGSRIWRMGALCDYEIRDTKV